MENQQGLIQANQLKVYTLASSNNFRPTRHRNPVKYNSGDRWCGLNSTTEEWWLVSFPFNKLFVESYYVSSTEAEFSPQSWTLQGFNDGDWEIISNITNSQLELNDTKIYTTQTTKFYSSFRFVNDDPPYYNETGEFHFCLYKIDFFGKFIKTRVTCISKKSYNIYIPFLAVLLSFS